MKAKVTKTALAALVAIGAAAVVTVATANASEETGAGAPCPPVSSGPVSSAPSYSAVPEPPVSSGPVSSAPSYSAVPEPPVSSGPAESAPSYSEVPSPPVSDGARGARANALGSCDPEEPEPSSNIFSLLAGSMVLLMMVVFVGAAIAGRRQRRSAVSTFVAGDDSRPVTTASGPDPLARAAEVGLAEAGDLSREPREAIIACYAAMERELENSPEVVPRESDTPSEVLARAVEHHALQADSAIELVELFEEARFSPHVMTEEHRQVAVRVLRLVLAELRSVA